ncbi:MAG: low-specificity L-threonine aldolase [Proteobacteria bacterium]|nr:low-specificity L-threonine aldolase [Pseudomonadota bacterium]MBU2228228.1 low-specificity L-threonine aldolase [Pseudomonadota bacterium]MBU2262437.1 low-specificity L-threonine aldolase [Pseudomonadota bacterium]
MPVIDLRSDTVTLPTPAMREAVFRAELGDDVFREDPTINRLEQMTAERVGKESALLVASGTMGNIVSVLTHCARSEEAILGDCSHIFLNEAGGMSALGGIFPHTIPNRPDGTMAVEQIEAAIRADNIHFPKTRLICLENTHNRCYGAPLTPEYTDAVAALAKRHGLLLHLDGARIFNAAVALGVDVRELTRGCDSLNVCLSKGLAAPVGSVICGSRNFIARARRIRKMLGGGMRQAGIIAAAGIVALQEMVDRLTEDHANARRLAEGIAIIPGLATEPDRVKTNILYIDLVDRRFSDEEFMARLEKKGVRLSHPGPARFRMLTHYGIGRAEIDMALTALHEVMQG